MKVEQLKLTDKSRIAEIPEGTVFLDCSCNEELRELPPFPKSLKTIYCWDCAFEEEYIIGLREQYPDVRIISEDVIQTEEGMRKSMEDFLNNMSDADRAVFTQVLMASRNEILKEFSKDKPIDSSHIN